MNSVIFLFTALAAYCIGSLSFAIMISKIKNLKDPREFGSNNPGATNMLRSGEKFAAALTLAGDMAKGFLAVWFAIIFFSQQHLAPGLFALLISTTAIAVILGHMWPVFFRFQGGKGVATGLGVMLAFNPWLGLCVLAVWLITVGLTKISSLGALIATLSAPFFALYWLVEPTYIATIFLIAVFIIRRHKKNMINLMTGKEPTARDKPPIF